MGLIIASYQSGLNHPGPAIAYLARAPNDDLTNFSGVDGNWFKIAELLAETDDRWKIQDYDQRFVSGPTFLHCPAPD